MNTFYALSATENPMPREKMRIKKLKKKAANAKQAKYAVHKSTVEDLQTLQKNPGKQHVFNTQLSSLIDGLPDAILLKDRAGRKLITNQLTRHLFKQHDLHWYGKTAFAQQKLHTDRVRLESDLRHALAKRQFKLYYQIQVDGNRQMLGAEVLLRWKHPHFGLLLPEQFISIAEQTGLILPVGAWVLQAACEQLKLWESDLLRKDLSIAVNISASQFNRPEFVEQLKQTMDGVGINPARLKLELTESLMLHDIANTIEKMKRLQGLGVRFSMDNFGTGYSSLGHLKQLPIDQLKIDEYLMRDIAVDSADAMIVKTIVDMTHKLGISVIAEGVETEQQFTCLKQLGCSAFQGYLFGKPQPLNTFEKHMSRLAS